MPRKGYKQSKEHKEKAMAGLKNRTITPEESLRRSKSQKGKSKNWTEDGYKRLCEAAQQRTMSDETKSKISNTLKGRTLNSKTRKKMSKAALKVWEIRSEEEKLKITKPGRDAVENYPSSSIETKVKEQLSLYNVAFVSQKKICNGHFVLDFWLPEYQLVIECNGDYWHLLPQRIERDKQLEEYLKLKKVDILWLWEHNIKSNDFDIAEYLEV